MSSLQKRLLYGWTELHVAADAGELAKVQQAVQRSPNDLNKTTKDGRTALHLAAARGYEPVVVELLSRQAKTAVQDEAGRTALHLAAVAGRAGCVALLLGPRNRDPQADRIRLLALRDREGRDALMAAVLEGQTVAVEALLAAGADARRCMDNSGCGLVLAAVRRGHSHALLRTLVAACGGPDAQRDPVTGGTALHAAAEAGDLALIDTLLQLGASKATRDNAGRTASEAALAAGQHAAIRALRESLAAAALPAAAAGLYDHRLIPPPSAVAAPSARNVSGGGGCGAGGPVSATPWGDATVPGDGAPEPSAVSAGRLQIPVQPPPSVYYPTPPSGAPVFY